MDQKKSHNITPKPKEAPRRDPRPTTDRIEEQGREKAIISPDRGVPKKKVGGKGPLSVGVDFDK